MIRLILAATLGANYGIYGPAFELCDNTPREPGSEEYLNSEKYEIKRWQHDHPDNLSGLITRVNRIRKTNLALQRNWGLHFHATDNDNLICYSKTTDGLENVIVTVVNVNPHDAHCGWVELDLNRPLGVYADSYDVWRERNAFVLQASGGAPPDRFFTPLPAAS